MTEEEIVNPKASDNEAVLAQQYLRAMSSFEGIILGQIEVKNKLGDRLNYGIRAGLIILGMIALSIFVLLLMLSIQMNRISDVVADMNHHFSSVSLKMDKVTEDMLAMESQIALMSDIELYTTIMTQEMDGITMDIGAMEQSVTRINHQFGNVRQQIQNIAMTIHNMNGEVQVMNQKMHRMSEPARTLNWMMPFPLP